MVNYNTMGFFKKISSITLDILFPPVCLNCGKGLKKEESEAYICLACFNGVSINSSLTCPVCGARLAENKKSCHKNSSFMLAAASFYTNEITKNLIWKLKYERKTIAAKTLARIIQNHIKNARLALDGYFIVPIPLHKKREKNRGFNQSMLIAEYLKTELGLPVINALTRNKDTLPQIAMPDFKSREENLKESFEITQKDAVLDKKIIILDDVLTSGATMEEAAKVLKKAGAKKILGIVAAKA